jgi:peptidyl-tRNA hydrolase
VDDDLVQYYLARRGQQADGALALLAARAALLGHARWAARPTYRRWRDAIMTKVVLEAEDEDLARVREATETIALDPAGTEVRSGEAVALLVLPPQPRADLLPLIGHLRLAARRRGQAPEPERGPVLLLTAAGDLGMHGGKLAAQAAHAALLAEAASSDTRTWAEWEEAGAPLALRRATSTLLAALAARYPASAVHDVGHTQVPAGTLTVVAIPPGVPDGERLLRELPPW